MLGARGLLWLLLAANFAAAIQRGSVSNGWNARIGWKGLSDGLKEGRKSQKPLMVLIHQSWCGACKALKPLWVKSKEIEELSKHYVMVNAGDHDEPRDAKFRPEGHNGGYYPRIIFLRGDGSRIDGIQGPSKEHSAYFSKPPQIVAAMRQALFEVGVDLDAEARAKAAAAAKAKMEQAKAYAESVPGMLEAIFKVVDSDGNKQLSHQEFAQFMSYSKGQVPSPKQYEKMCDMHGSPDGLTLQKMQDVYGSRPVAELKKLHTKVLDAVAKKAKKSEL